jgi:hypothetical protein
MNLIPNPDFAQGMGSWEATPGGVTLVQTHAKRFVLLAGQRRAAAICSDPVEVVPGAAYRLVVERAIPGEVQVLLLSREAARQAAPDDEFVAWDTPIRVQLTTPAGKRAGVSRVTLEPVGARLEMSCVRDTVAFVEPGAEFEILVEVENTGSDVVSGATATLIAPYHDLAEEHRDLIRVPPLTPGETATLSWLIAKQHRASAGFEIRLEYGTNNQVLAGATLRHRPSAPERKTLKSVDGGWQWFTISSRGLRLTAHETDFDYGPMLLTDEKAKRDLGVIQRIGRIVHKDGAADLWSRKRRITPAGIQMTGHNDIAEWEVEIRPEHRLKGILLGIRLGPKRRIAEAHLELAPFQTLLPLTERAGGFVVGAPGAESHLVWSVSGGVEMRTRVLARAGVVALVSGRTPLLPGRMQRIEAVLHRFEGGIISADPR